MTIQTVRPSARIGLWVLLIAATALGVSTSAQSRPYGGTGSTGVTVFINPNFNGQSASFRNDTPTLVPFNLNDKISSIQIPNGETWEVCQDINYGNQCQVLSSSVPDLRSMGWNDRISSLRRINNGGFRDRRSGGVIAPGVQQNLLFYDRPGYKGRSTLVTSGSSNVGFSARQGSLQLRGGGPWEVCDGSGRCATINQDVSDVSQLGLNGRITSARPVNNSQYGGNGRSRGRGNGNGNGGNRYYGR